MEHNNESIAPKAGEGAMRAEIIIRMHSIHRFVAFSLLLIFSGMAQAESLYLRQLKQARWSDQDFEKTIEKLELHEPIKVAEPLKVAPFHYRQASSGKVNRDFCVACHTALPHTESERLRSYLNMHVNYLACASCHFQPEQVNLAYRWYQWKETSEQTEESGLKLIMPFYRQSAETLSKKHPEIAKILADWKVSDIQRKAQLHLRIHVPIKPEGRKCDACHTNDDPLLDYAELGFGNEAIKVITDNRISRYLSDDRFKDKPIKLMDLLQ
jgi:hypothetical protein